MSERKPRAVHISGRMTNLELILWSLDTSNSLIKNQVADLFSCLVLVCTNAITALPQRGSITKPRVGRALCGLPWEEMRVCSQPWALRYCPFRVAMNSESLIWTALSGNPDPLENKRGCPLSTLVPKGHFYHNSVLFLFGAQESGALGWIVCGGL